MGGGEGALASADVLETLCSGMHHDCRVTKD